MKEYYARKGGTSVSGSHACRWVWSARATVLTAAILALSGAQAQAAQTVVATLTGVDARGQVRFSAAAGVVKSRVWEAPNPTRPRPQGRPDWEFLLANGSRHRTLLYWSAGQTLGEAGEGGALQCWGAPGVAELLPRLTPGVRPPTVGGNSRKWETAALGRGGSRRTTFSTFVNDCGPYVFRGVVVGITECYFAGHPRRQWTSYVVRVVERLSKTEPSARLVRVAWPGGYLNGGEVRDRPLLPIGGQFVFIGRPYIRHRRGDGDQIELEDHGELQVGRLLGSGAEGLGLLAIRDGIVVPPFPEWKAEWRARVASGAPVPMWGESRYDQRRREPLLLSFPAFGLRWIEYRAKLKGKLR